jgi:hypothetical protein
MVTSEERLGCYTFNIIYIDQPSFVLYLKDDKSKCVHMAIYT